MLNLSGSRPTGIGAQNGKLNKCSWKPNCVCSHYENDQDHFIKPIQPSQGIDSGWKQLIALVESEQSAKIIESTDNYLYAEYSSQLLGFVDDVEFLADRSAGIIHVRSASRLGIRDFGVNRKRIEDLRGRL